MHRSPYERRLVFGHEPSAFVKHQHMKPVIRKSTAPIVGSHVPLELVAVALTQLYFRDDHRRVFYEQQRRGFTTFLSDCVSGEIVPERTELQGRLGELLGGATEAHLYIPRFESDVPTHYISIGKDSKGLWRLRHPKIRATPNRISYGALISWRPVTPVPGVCIELTPAIAPIARGKTSFDQFITDASECYITKRELSHCSIILRMFGLMGTGRMPVWFPTDYAHIKNCTRVAFTVEESGDGWVAEHTFRRPTIRRGVPYPAQRNISIMATPTPIDTGTKKFHSFMPVTPKLEPVEDHLLGELKFVLEQLFNTRLVPFVCVTLDGYTADMYTSFYYPDTNTPEIVKIAEGRRVSNCENLPIIKPWKGYDGFWIPNAVFGDLLRRMVVSENDYLFNAVGRAMSYFGAAKLESYNKVFKRYGCQLTDRELELMQARLDASLQETRVARRIDQDGGP